MKEEYLIKTNDRWLATFQDEFDESLLLFLTEKCNLACQNCFMAKNNSFNEISMDEIKKIIEANPRFKKIDLMGGEPLLYSDIHSLIKYLKELRKEVSLYTNAILLDKLSTDVMPLRACISFSELESNNPSRKPLLKIADKIERYHSMNSDNKIKLILLLDDTNYKNAIDYINLVEKQFPWLDKITIGLMRNEDDYWNDNLPGVLSFSKYAETIQYIVDNYTGKLNMDIFLKGVLTFDLEEENMEYPNRVNRFKCVFTDLSYSECLYDAHLISSKYLDDTYRLPECSEHCKHLLKKKCIADKVRLINRGK